MPTISMFFGIIIRMYWELGNKHNMPHFHAKYADFEAEFDFNGNILAGAFPAKQKILVEAWAVLHADELKANWELAVNQEELFRIDPLR